MGVKPKIYFDDNDDQQPDTLELVVRSVCGAFLGLVLAGVACWRLRLSGVWHIGAMLILGAGLCAYGAAKHGDDFWWGILGGR